MKFKIGDKVRIVKNVWGNSNHTDVGIGDVCTITSVANYNARYPYRLDKHTTFSWCDEELELVDNSKIVITHDGKTTTATLYEDGKKVKTATAKCAPEDTFDFMVGAKLAVERLSPKTEETEWRVVKRPVRVGDYIRLTTALYSFSKVGDILKVSNIPNSGCVSVNNEDHPNTNGFYNHNEGHWNYSNTFFEIVERVTKKVEPPKSTYYNGKVVCVSNYGDKDFTVGKVYEIVDGKFTDNKGHIRPVCSEKVESLTDFTDSDNYFNQWFYKFIPFNGEVENHNSTPKYFNGKVVCIDNRGNDSIYTVGKVYEFVNGKMINDVGTRMPSFPVDSFEAWCKWTGSKFIPYVED